VYYRALRVAIGRGFLIVLKVQLVDALYYSSRAWRTHSATWSLDITVDFVLRDSRSTQILAAVELDGKTNNLTRRKRLDDEAFDAAQIPLIGFKASTKYDCQLIAKGIWHKFDSPRFKYLAA
jgi:hypothetical protein